jgi:glutaredoxin
MRPELTLYGRRECHLCQDMAASLDELRVELGFDYAVVDVDDEPALAERYGPLVPVLSLDGEPICHYFLDLPALKARLAAVAAARSE